MQFLNELILLISVLAANGTLLVLHRFFGKEGVFTWTVICMIASNIEVLILINAFGCETTLGNVLFASSFLATDILSELYGKKEADRCVLIGFVANVIFIIISLSWFIYVPSSNDTMSETIRSLFSRTPRIMAASLVTYIVCQFYDVWSYHFIWKLTEKKCGDRKKYLWLRNNASTLVSQLINTVMFNLLAFAGVYPKSTLIQIMIFGFAFFAVTSLLDTPFLYLVRNKTQENKYE